MAIQVYYNGGWSDRNTPILGPMDHASWQASVIFDGARAFGGLAPDLDRHCERAVASALKLGLQPKLDARAIQALCVEGIRRFPREAELYVRPMFFARVGLVNFDPDSTDFCLVIHKEAMPQPTGFTACISPFRRPAPDMAPTDAKASCLYPNSARAIRDAIAKGFNQAIVLDHEGNIAEFASSNIWIAKGGVAMTPVPNGTFLAGVTRRRVMDLLTGAGIQVEERKVTVHDVLSADEVFSTGNYGKVLPVTRIENRELQPGPIFSRARQLYFDFAKSTSVF